MDHVEGDDRYEGLILWVVTDVPAHGIAFLAALLYFGVGLALSLGLGWPTLYLAAHNFMGTVFAVSLLLFENKAGWALVLPGPAGPQRAYSAEPVPLLSAPRAA
jgi:hypothetical protein